MPTVIIQCADNHEVTVDEESAKLSNVIANVIPYTKPDKNGNYIVPFCDYEGKIIEKIMDWNKFYKTVKEPSEPIVWAQEPREVQDFKKKYFEMEEEVLEDVTIVANYLNVTKLYEECCKTIANLIMRCKSAEEIREKFNVVKDLTEEEEIEIRKANSWSSEFDQESFDKMWEEYNKHYPEN